MTWLALRLSTQSSESSMISAETTDVSGSRLLADLLTDDVGHVLRWPISEETARNREDLMSCDHNRSTTVNVRQKP